MAEQRLDIIVSVKGGAQVALTGIGTALRGLGNFALSVANQIAGLVRRLFSLQGIILGVGVGALAKQFVDAASGTERLQARLKVLTGDVARARLLFAQLEGIVGKTATTMSELEGVVTSLATVMTAGDIEKFLPVVVDLAEVTGLSVEVAAQNMIKAYGSGISAAQMFVERGIDLMLGFQKGVQYTAEETRQRILEAFTDPNSKLRGAAEAAAKTWDGAMKRISNAWYKFRSDVMASGLFDFLKESLNVVLGLWGDLSTDTEAHGKIVKSVSDKAISVLKGIALTIGTIVDGWTGLKLAVQTVRLAFAVVFEKLAEFVRGGELAFLVFKQAVISVEGAATALGKVFGEVFQWILDQVVVVVGQISSVFAKLNEVTKGRLGFDTMTQGLNNLAAVLYGAGTAVQQFTSETAAGVAEQSKQIDASIAKLGTQKTAAMEFWAEEQRIAKERILALAAEVGARESVAAAFEEIERRMAEAAAQRAADSTQAVLASGEKIKSFWELLNEQYQQTSKQVTNLDVLLQGVGATAGTMADTLGDAYELSGKKRKEFLIAQKAFLIAETIMSTYASAQKAYESMASIPSVGPTLGAIAAATAIAQGMVRVAMISAQGLAVGGLVKGYSPTPTSDNVPIRATAGEFVESVPAVRHYGADVMEAINQRRVPRALLRQFAVPGAPPSVGHRFAAGGTVPSSAAAPVKATQNINNFVDPELFSSYVGSRLGEDDVVNVISRRAFEIKQLLRG